MTIEFPLSHVCLPTSLSEIPAGEEHVNLRGVNLLSEDMSRLPRTIRYINLTGQWIDSLDFLHACDGLEYVDCSLCRKLTQNTVDRFRERFPDAHLDLYGCWQLARTDVGVREQEDKIFNMLGFQAPRLWSKNDSFGRADVGV